MKREDIKTRADLAEYLVGELAEKKPDLNKEEVNQVISAVMSGVKYDSSVQAFLDGYQPNLRTEKNNG